MSVISRPSLGKYPSLPSHEETAEKLTKFFFRSDHGPRKLVKRQALATFFDIMYILDSSSSVSDWEFQRAVQAIQTMVAKSKRDNRHAVITIATRAKTFMNFSSRADAVRKLRGISRSGGKTNTQDALELAFQMFTTSKYGSTPGGLARVLVVTDGRSNIEKHRTERKAFKLKANGIEVFVIAIGDYLEGMDELARMANTKYAHMYRVEDVKGLARVVKLIPRLQEREATNYYGGRPPIEGNAASNAKLQRHQ
ncbi:predicted protein [Nematostella vectensis]|uniref:VWFA domain-containing protein n=1 Tax=Nematostella vectensis TaxID=45351 RepID=A8DUP6_NEMVE|nr:predicted protein [Nematostella vectensis]|eukprot:XP_001620878.1 hypothetical protein NEMVEDRAFT_v1g222619 [Nematostella vectensis]